MAFSRRRSSAMGLMVEEVSMAGGRRARQKTRVSAGERNAATFLDVGEAAIYSLLFCGVSHRQDMRRRAMFEVSLKEARCVPVRLLAKA
jgi:hypothetical protein